MATKGIATVKNTVLNWHDGEAIDKAIKKFVSRDSKSGLRDELQGLLVACAKHAVEHTSADKLTNLWNQLPDHWNKKNGVGKWISKFTSYELKKDKAGTVKFLAKTVLNQKQHAFVAEGEGTPFWVVDGVEQANSKPFSLAEALFALVKKADKKAETSFDKALLDTLHSVVEGIKAPKKDVNAEV